MKITSTSSLLITTLALITPACGGGGGGGGGGQQIAVPAAQLHFPPPTGLTDAASVAVRGAVTQRTGVEAVFVGDVPAVSDDDWKTWRAEVPLDLGDNELVVTLRDADGETIGKQASATLHRQDLTLGNVAGLAVDPARNLAWSIDVDRQRLVKLDLATGKRTSRAIFTPFGEDSDPIHLGGDPVHDPGRDVLFVPDGNRIHRIDTATGRRVEVIELFGGVFTHVRDIVYSPGLDELIVLSSAHSLAGPPRYSVYRIDGETFNAQLASSWDEGILDQIPARQISTYFIDAGVLVASASDLMLVSLIDGQRQLLAGMPASDVADMCFDQSDQRLMILDRSAGLYEYSWQNGMSELVYEFEEGVQEGGTLALGAPGAEVLFTDGRQDAVFRFDRANRIAKSIAASHSGEGLHLSRMRASARAEASRLAVDYDTDRLFRIDAQTGDRTLLSEGDLISFPTAVLPHGGGAYVGCAAPGRIVFVDQEGGQSLVAEEAELAQVRDMVSYEGSLFVLCTSRLVRVDPATGQTEVVMTSDDNLGPAFSFAEGLTLSDDLVDGAYMTTRETIGQAGGQVFLVNLVTGFRLPLAGTDLGAGVSVGRARGVALRGAEAGLFVASGTEGIGGTRVYSLDMATLWRSDVSSSERGRGPLMDVPASLYRDPATDTLWMVGQTEGALLAIDPQSGDRVLFSR